MIALSAVPYDASVWQDWWNAVMTTIGAASNIGMIIFIALTVVTIFRIIINKWMH